MGGRARATLSRNRKGMAMTFYDRIPWDMSDGRFWEPIGDNCSELFLMFDTDAHVSDGVPDVPVIDVIRHVAECDACCDAFVMVNRTGVSPVLLFDW